MSNNTDKISFWKFLNDNSIEIPIIQRDYAQGRLGKEILRKNFLSSLKQALDDKVKGGLKLDFIYGSTENGKLIPLDGQQRLTTLWLLHWYVALRAGVLSEASETLKKFSYETRISSREFCEKLCTKHFDAFKGEDENVVDFITKQTWFYSAWKQDPTIQSMLRMLSGTKIADKRGVDIVDGIEEVFKECSNDDYKRYWEKLTKEDVIVFYIKSLENFGLSDDLYIKMNARGKQLTSFENFKADLVGYIRNKSEDLPESEQIKWALLLDAEKGISIKMDTTWTDIFWKKRSNDNVIDEIFFAFLNRFFWNELFTAKSEDESFILGVGKGDGSSTRENNNASYRYLNNSDAVQNDYDTTISYQGLDVYRYCSNEIPYQLFSDLQLILDSYYRWLQKQSDPKKLSDLFSCPWGNDGENEFYFIPQYEKNNSGNNEEINDISGNKIWKVTHLTQVHRIVFFAICKYFKESGNNDDFDEISLQRWMRVVWNLVSGDAPDGKLQIRSTNAVRDAINFIDSDRIDSHNVYESLKNYDFPKEKSSEFDNRCIEEINKAIQILDENGELRKYDGTCTKKDGTKYETWEEIIIDAEKTAFFKGAIRFLYTNKDGDVCWSDFDTKFEHARIFFDDKGVSKECREKSLLLRALLSRITVSEKWFGNHSSFWYTELLNEDKSVIHNLLTNKPSVSEKCIECWITNEYLIPALLEKPSSWHILENWRKYKVLTRYSKRIVGKVNCWDEVVVINHPRNSLLSQLQNNDKIYFEIRDGRKINETEYLLGWDIDFKYSGYFFQWYGNPSEKELDVYLMESEWADRQKRQNSLTNKNTDADNYFCFRVKENLTTDDFLRSLNDLIAEKSVDEDSLSYSKECGI